MNKIKFNNMRLFYKNSFFIITALILGGSMTGCKKFLDVNTSPNTLSSTQTQFLMTGALSNSVRNQITSSSHIVPGTWSGLYGHSTSYTGGGAEKTYVVTSTDFDWFTSFYDNVYDYQRVIDAADADKVPYWKAPARIMQCYIFARLVDTYGDVPFQDAGHSIAKLTPKYEKGQDIYDSLILRLDAAMDEIQNTPWPDPSSTEATQDIFFSLVKSDWIHLANTLKLRLLLHQDFMGTRDAYIVSNIQATAALGYLDKNVAIQPGYAVSAGKLNPYYSTYGYNEANTVTTNHQYRKMNRVIINSLLSTHDDFRLQGLAWPKGSQVTAPLPSYPSTVASYTYFGVPMGAGSGAATGNSSAQGPFYIQKGVTGSQVGALIFFTLAESKLLQAEAAEKYPALQGVLGDPETLYNEGVHADYRLVGNKAYNVSTSGIRSNAANVQADLAFDDYIAQPVDNVNWTASTDKLRAILIQKWIAFTHINGLEAWTDYRKSSVTSFNGHTWYSVPMDPRSQTAGTRDEPMRMVYPQIEFTTNGDNVPQDVNDVQSHPIFWDVNN